MLNTCSVNPVSLDKRMILSHFHHKCSGGGAFQAGDTIGGCRSSGITAFQCLLSPQLSHCFLALSQKRQNCTDSCPEYCPISYGSQVTYAALLLLNKVMWRAQQSINLSILIPWKDRPLTPSQKTKPCICFTQQVKCRSWGRGREQKAAGSWGRRGRVFWLGSTSVTPH